MEGAAGIERTAQILHDAWVAEMRSQGYTEYAWLDGHDLLAPWADAAESIKENRRNVAERFLAGLREAGLCPP